MSTRFHAVAALAVLALGCGPSLDEACLAACEHDARCGLEHACDTWVEGCVAATDATQCDEELQTWATCSQNDLACFDTCDEAYFAWVLCLADATTQ